MDYLNVPYSVSPSDSGWQWFVNFTGCAPDRDAAVAEAIHTIKKAIRQDGAAVERLVDATRNLTESYSELQRLRSLVEQAEHRWRTRAHRPNTIADVPGR